MRASAKWLAVVSLLAAGCSERDMAVQPKYKPLQEMRDKTSTFADGRASRPIEPGTIAVGQLMNRPAFDTGEVDGKLVGYVPLKGFDPNESEKVADPSAERKRILERGQGRFNIFCAPCHDRAGTGNGMIVQRGFSKPPSLHLDRLRDVPPGHFFHVMTNGYGAMYSYASRISPADRWAIAAYIRALQMTRNPGNTKVADARPAEGASQ